MIALGVLVLLAVAGYFLRGLFGATGGAKNPQAAVERLAKGLEHEDGAAVAASIAPDEVRTLGDVYGAVQRRASKVGLGGKRSTFQGVDLKLNSLEMDVDDLAKNVARVTIRNGTLAYEIQRDRLAPTTKRLASKADPVESGTVSAGDFTNRQSGLFINHDPYLITVKRGGGWYVSMTYTVADYLVRTGDRPAGSFSDDSIDTKPAADPRTAVKDLIEKVADLDVDGTAAALSQPEWSVVHVYRRAIEDVIHRAQADGNLVDVHFHINDSDLAVQNLPGNAKKVTIRGASGDLSWTDEAHGQQRRNWQFDGRCMRVSDPSGDASDTEECIRTDTYLGRQIGLDSVYVVVVAERGGWAVSPVSTFLSYARELTGRISDDLVFKLLDRPDLAKPTGSISPHGTVKGTLNPSGYVSYVLHPTSAGPVVVSALDGIDDFNMYDSTGEIVDYKYTGNAAIYDLTPKEYRLVGWRDHYDSGKQGELLVTPLTTRDMPATGLTGGTVSGNLSAEQPLIDYRFRTTDSTTRLLSVDSGDISASILDTGDNEVCTGQATCELDGGTDYRLRVSSTEGSVGGPYTVRFVESPATVDGASEVSGYLGYGETDPHTIAVGPGRSVTMKVSSIDPLNDVDVRLSDGRVFNTTGDESFAIEGPFDGNLDVYIYSSSSSYGSETGSYTITLQAS